MVESTNSGPTKMKQNQSENPRMYAQTMAPSEKRQDFKIQEARRKSQKLEFMDANVKQFERKLKDFEAMFEYISSDLDFSKLDQALFPD